jgi:hypothetical protein
MKGADIFWIGDGARRVRRARDDSMVLGSEGTAR